MTTIQQVLGKAVRRLSDSDSPQLDAEVLLAWTLDKQRSFLYTHPEQCLDAAQLEHFLALVERRERGEPVAHITGLREFWSLALAVTQDTLIPRPETELLVEQTLLYIPSGQPFTIADLGTGSGAIAVAIASERPHCRVIASDSDLASVRLAKVNASRLQLANVSPLCAGWCRAFSDRSLDLVVANPPYIARTDPHLDQGDVRFEPRRALVSGDDGLEDIRRIARQAGRVLKRGGRLLLEHGMNQQEAVQELLEENQFTEIQSHRDLAGRPRVSGGVMTLQAAQRK